MGKLKDKIKAKVEAKTARTKKAKPSAAAKVARACSVLALALGVAVASGCATQPSRAQTASIKADRIVVQDARGAAALELVRYAASNGVDAAELAELFKALPAGDFALVSQAMAIETGGSESNSQTSTPTTTTPVDVMRGTGGGSSWGDFFSGLKSAFGLGASGEAAADKENAAACADGSCSTAAGN